MKAVVRGGDAGARWPLNGGGAAQMGGRGNWTTGGFLRFIGIKNKKE